MISSMSKVNRASRAINLFGKSKLSIHQILKQSICLTECTSSSNESSNNFGAQTAILEQIDGSKNHSDKLCTPKTSISLSILQNVLEKPENFFEKQYNRDKIVFCFHNISKKVLEDGLDINEVIDSQTYGKLRHQLELHIDKLTTGQLVNLLSSYIKMKVDSSDYLYKLFEHEAKFRMRSLTIGHAIKLLNFYKSIELTFDQRQLVDSLVQRIRNCIKDENVNVKDLNGVLRLISQQQLPKLWLPLIQEKLLSILTTTDKMDEAIDRLIGPEKPFDYDSICNLFIELANAKARPTPVLKAASQRLCELPLHNPEESETNSSDLLIPTLGSLSSLNFIKPVMIDRILKDLQPSLSSHPLDIRKKCDLLKHLNSLRWRSEEVLEVFIKQLKEHSDSNREIDHRLLLSLIHYSSVVDHHSCDFKSICKKFVDDHDNSPLTKEPRSCLYYVWSLVTLNIAKEPLVRHVLQREFHRKILGSSPSNTLRYSDQMRLLNILGIAKNELNLVDLDQTEHLLQTPVTIRPSASMQKLSTKIQLALDGIVDNSSLLKHDIQTPFGFSVNTEIWLNQDSKLIAPDGSGSLSQVFASDKRIVIDPQSGMRKAALIYATFDETLVNDQDKVVGHKKLISRILRPLGYETVFLTESFINRSQTSSELVSVIKNSILNSFKPNR